MRQHGRICVGRHDTHDHVDDGAEVLRILEDVRHPSFDEHARCGSHQEGSKRCAVHNDFMTFKLSGQSSKPFISLNSNRLVPRPKEELHVIGFGDMDPGKFARTPNRLHEVTVDCETNAECGQNSIRPNSLLHSSSMHARDCEHKEDACNGESS